MPRLFDQAVLVGAALAAVALAVPAATAPEEAPLARLGAGPGELSWDGLELGMSLVQVERRVGGALGIDDAGGRGVCSKFAGGAERNGLTVVLGFPSARPGAKLESLWVQFEGHQVAASAAELEQALLALVPQATYLERAGVARADDPRPVFVLPGEPTLVVRIHPREGILLARRDCLE